MASPLDSVYGDGDWPDEPVRLVNTWTLPDYCPPAVFTDRSRPRADPLPPAGRLFSALRPQTRLSDADLARAVRVPPGARGSGRTIRFADQAIAAAVAEDRQRAARNGLRVASAAAKLGRDVASRLRMASGDPDAPAPEKKVWRPTLAQQVLGLIAANPDRAYSARDIEAATGIEARRVYSILKASVVAGAIQVRVMFNDQSRLCQWRVQSDAPWPDVPPGCRTTSRRSR